MGRAGSYPSTDMQSVYSTALANWAYNRILEVRLFRFIIMLHKEKNNMASNF